MVCMTSIANQLVKLKVAYFGVADHKIVAVRRA